MEYANKPTLFTMVKQSQNKPNFTRRSSSEGGQTQPVVSLPALSAVERPALSLPVVSLSNQSKESNLLQTQFFLFFTFLCPSYNLTMQNWTIQKLLNWVTEHFTEKGIDSPRLSAELLLSHVVGLKRIELYTQFDKPVARQQLNRLRDLVKRASQHEPVAYLVGKTEFYCLELNVTPDCMIPRPETEFLVERAIEFLRTRTGKQFVCDLCTGSGCIAVAIARNYPDCRIIATDISDAALSVAAKNIEKHRLKERIRLLCGDLFDPLAPQLDADKFDLIVCNPPYVSAAEFEKLGRNIKDYEPKSALFAGADGLDIYRRIIEKVDTFLKPDTALMLEVGYNQGQAVKQLLEQAGCFSEIIIEKDTGNNDRIAIAKKQKTISKI